MFWHLSIPAVAHAPRGAAHCPTLTLHPICLNELTGPGDVAQVLMSARYQVGQSSLGHERFSARFRECLDSDICLEPRPSLRITQFARPVVHNAKSVLSAHGHLTVADLRKVPAILVDLVIYDKHFTLGYASKGLATVGRFLTLEMSLSGNIMRRLVSREYCNWSFPVRFCGQC